jgi:methyl-accepting chemotaxis protein
MDNHHLSERLSYIGLNSTAQDAIRSCAGIIQQELPAILDAVYMQIRSNAQTKNLFSDGSRMDWAKQRQLEHWARIGRAEFDEHYATAVTKVGHVHARVGLEPRYYIGSYALIIEGLLGKLLEASWPKGLLGKTMPGLDTVKGQLAGVIKAALLDMDLAISVYIEASDQARRAVEEKAHESERRVAEERDRALTDVGAALSALADGDLTRRLTGQLPPDFAKIGADYDVTAERLEEFAEEIKAIAAETSHSAGEIRAGAQDLSNRTEQQASALEETAATTEELAASVKASAQSSRQAVSLAQEATGVATDGGRVVRDAVEAMARIEQASQKISDITGVIDEIAFQTNLLALNAAVEAARAGDAGKGFAVVAAEVRTLAQRSSEAAKDITGLISASGDEVTQGVDLVRKTGEALERIVQASNKVSSTVSEISAASDEQAGGIDEMAQAVAHMDEMTQQNAAMAEESAAAASELSRQVQRLREHVERFRTSRSAPMPAAKRGPAPEATSEPDRLRRLAAGAFKPKPAAAPAARPAQAAPKEAPTRKAAGGWDEF